MNENDKLAYEAKKQHCVNQPRLISVNMFVDMFEAVGVNSSLKRHLSMHDDQIEKIKKEMAVMNKRASELKTNIDNVEKTAERNLQNNRKE